MRWLVVGLLRVYRAVVSPLYGQVCKYHPSCSAYALEAVTRFGAAKGLWLAAGRLLRCNPWSLGGYDPVPGHVEDTPPESSGRLRRVVRDHGGAPGPEPAASPAERTFPVPASTREARP